MTNKTTDLTIDLLRKVYQLQAVSYDRDEVIYWGWNRSSICKVESSFNSLTLEEISFHREIISAREIGDGDVIVFFEGNVVRVFSFGRFMLKQLGVIIDLPKNLKENVRHFFILKRGEFKYVLPEESGFPRTSYLELCNDEWSFVGSDD
jgi:hypothetical protein